MDDKMSNPDINTELSCGDEPLFSLIAIPEFTMSISIMVSGFVAAITALVVLYFKTKVLPSHPEQEPINRYRFRKRDKVLFYGKKMLRKVKTFTKNTVGGTQRGTFGRKSNHRLMVTRLRRFLANRKDPRRVVSFRQQSPPQSFLEADWSDVEEDHRLPPEVLYMLRSVRVFGHLDKPFFLELCRFMETIHLRAGSFLFRIGDPDDSIYVLQSGHLEVYITNADGSEHLLKNVNTGQSIHSLLSILDVLTGHPAPFKSVSARASTDSTILRLPTHAFKSMFDKFNASAVKVVQIIMIRLQRVTFSALHNYLGLSSELLQSDQPMSTKELNIHQLKKVEPLSPADEVSKPSATNKDVNNESNKTSSIEGKVKSEPVSINVESTSMDFQSDFEQAAMQARVPPSKDPKHISVVLSGSPTNTWTRPSTQIESHSFNVEKEDGDLVLSLAAKDLTNILGLKNAELLENRLSIKSVRAGAAFCKQGDQNTSLFFLVKGSVNVSQNAVGEEAKEVLMYSVEPGEIIDVLGVLTGEPSFFTMRAKTDALMVVISKKKFYEIMKEEPLMVLNVAHTTVRRMSKFVRQIDFALDWQMLEAGKALFRQDEPSDSIFIVLTGRLRSVISTKEGKKQLVNEFGRGELVGVVEVLTQNVRATTVLAIRDTELAKIPSELLTVIKMRYPQVVTQLIHLLGNRILGNLKSTPSTVVQNPTTKNVNDAYMDRTTVANLATIALVPVSENVPLTNFSLELQHALLEIGPVLRLTPDIVKARLGNGALDTVNEFRLFNWLSQQEDIHRMVLYQCDMTLTRWTKHCLRQADCILIVGLGSQDPQASPIENDLEKFAVRAQKELILLHQEDAEHPRNTAEWLNSRGWLSSHHHIRCPHRMFKIRTMNKTLVMYDKLFERPPNKLSDFSRLARFLTGNSIGLVLGGGGARGFAHVGMIKAMQEAGVPIDMVGGTSMGSFIGALWADEQNVNSFSRRAREWAMRITSIPGKFRAVWDLTYPVTGLMTGWAFNEQMEHTFKETQIEDLWIPYFCISTNISNSSMRIHSAGSVWRYVRSSMSMSGYLPPLCDPMDGHLLLDGGYVNNLPADVMNGMGCKTVFAVDVGSRDEKELTNYGDSISGWRLLWKRYNPFASPVKVPDMAEIQSRLAYVSCVRQMELVKNMDYCEYIRPPIDRYTTLQFGAFDEINETGYHHGKTVFSAYKKGGLLDKLLKDFKEPKNSKMKVDMGQVQSHVPAMAFFTDLAEQVSRIKQPNQTFVAVDSDGSDNEDNMEGYEVDDEFAEEDEEEVKEVTYLQKGILKMRGKDRSDILNDIKRPYLEIGQHISMLGTSITKMVSSNNSDYCVLSPNRPGISKSDSIHTPDDSEEYESYKEEDALFPSLTNDIVYFESNETVPSWRAQASDFIQISQSPLYHHRGHYSPKYNTSGEFTHWEYVSNVSNNPSLVKQVVEHVIVEEGTPASSSSEDCGYLECGSSKSS